LSSEILLRVSVSKLTDILEVLTGLIALKMEAVSTSETSVTFYQTKMRNILENSHLQIAKNALQTSVRLFETSQKSYDGSLYVITLLLSCHSGLLFIIRFIRAWGKEEAARKTKSRLN
jgi:hypothetical protein